MPEEVLDQPTEALASPEETQELANGLFNKLLGEEEAPPVVEEQPPQKPVQEQTQPQKLEKATEPPKAEPEKATVASLTEEEVEAKPAGLSQKAGAAWEKKNETIKTQKGEIATLKQQLQESEGRYTGYVPPDKVKEYERQIQDYQAKLDEQDSIITKIKHEMHPKYKESIAIPLEQTTNKVKAIAERSNINPADLLNAIADPEGKRLDELLPGMSERDKVAALAAADKYQEIVEAKKARDEKALEDLKAWEDENRQQDEQQIARERALRERDIEDRMPNVHKKFERLAETEEEKNILKTAVEIAKQDILWQKPASTQAAAAVALAMAPFHIKRIDALKEENAALKAQLAGYRSSDPGAVRSHQPPIDTSVEDDENDTDIIGRVKRSAVPIGAR